ncbi:lysophospholipid acyltransferase family protein [Shewanella intestini]|uniref:1-acyl-sn-glycerol-3-phosphate acyltransferase n=1 Tax=Shewanella intestini TaxID=2017544 RepID=A0ABS5I3B8_9GAMM|nr:MULTISPECIES: lysophospholipid acyltransferase family protein [Shewanella]MBR9728313.1 1-acyl-sn-glycerol-3-phosphate acyltransferase [Shewanella intestini]MRG35778.1 1-acyl-sn-glycerol-3-phosphate acyltransferase [Shewanella sp. XMDDZSB0408]
MNTLSRYLRACASAIAFFCFGFGGLILSYIWFPILWLVHKDATNCELACQKSICKSFRFFVQFMHVLRILDIDIKNAERLSTQHGCIVVANHPTLIDVVILMGYMQQCDCIVKNDLFHNPFIRHIVNMAGFIPNQADDLITLCQQKLQQQRKLLIFPEGSRTVPGERVKCQRGAAQLAVRCHTDIQTVRIHCSPLALYKGCPWYNMPASPMTFTIDVDKPTSVLPIIEETPAPATAARKLTRYLNTHLQPNTIY